MMRFLLSSVWRLAISPAAEAQAVGRQTPVGKRISDRCIRVALTETFQTEWVHAFSSILCSKGGDVMNTLNRKT